MGATLLWRPFFYNIHLMSDKKSNEELRPSKMRGVAFPKAKYGAVLAVVIIIIVNLIYYKDEIIGIIGSN